MFAYTTCRHFQHDQIFPHAIQRSSAGGQGFNKVKKKSPGAQSFYGILLN